MLRKTRYWIGWCRRYASSSLTPSSGDIESGSFKSVAHSCWFRIPEQPQMKEYEILARGSGCIVRGKDDNLLWALVSAHVAVPFLFRNYFPQDWLSYVNEQHCKHTLYWETDDHHPQQVETGNIIWKHDMLDVAAFGLQRHELVDEKEWERLTRQAVELKPLSDWFGNSVIVQGWQVKGSVGSGQEEIVARSLNGTIRVQQQGIRYFVDTQPHQTHFGMCGGPILLPQSNHPHHTCVGIVEGLVPDANSLEHSSTQKEWKEFFQSIAGYTAFIEASVLIDFIDQIEKQL
ncbi:hypothetical protein GpartN1_g6932.t1 [Galdieria partita]|uniref:Uncharacterized protein n=1 Tax=Galdieria partita TaxID=83374 RepID=A0A9C7Q2R4_9RHOD|nr:hypothetical protein GpartN1_g6094.t1 [Galdieria partita]GJQ15141.1 hypothetical protein GpartN1_g6932.t1 [Galdieria partita]